MTTKLKWRLSKLPSVEELRDLVKDKVISNEEAREVLFTSETDEDRDKKGLEGEIKFLRELVEKLSERTKIVETIKTIEHNYQSNPWYQPYYTWTVSTGPNCTTTGGNYSLGQYTTCTGGSSIGDLGGSAGISTAYCSTIEKGSCSADSKFSDISTF